MQLHGGLTDGISAMKRNSRHHRQRLAKSSPALPARRPREAKSIGPRDLRAMSRTDLVALVLELQAREATASRAEATAVDTAAEVAPAVAAKPIRPALVIESSVRSGQTIEFPDGDV